ncbi:hypothetical protein [Leifsonia aquatica]|uniref:hypothetical protein n=1 Tax=Leifsonia aquatica TaxID=144185 RepID=UPI0013B36F1F|nr:hypothetical protein [Leifsonia aquatica]
MTERRRLAIVDGPRVHEIVVPAGTAIETALDGIGLRLEPGRHVLVERTGREVAIDQPAWRLDDGALLAVVDLHDRVVADRRRGAETSAAATTETVAWWILGGVGVVVTALALTGGASVPDAARLAMAVGLAVGATVSGVTWSVRARDPRAPASRTRGATADAAQAATTAAPAALGPLALAFAAGVAAIPPAVHSLPLVVLTGFAAAAVLSAVIALVAGTEGVRDSAGTAAVVLLILGAIWALALLLGLPAQGAAAITLGAAPVALRALPTMLLDVPPGMFIDYQRYQTTRWAVRERVPEPGGPVTLAGARRIAGQSTARMRTATGLIAGAAAVAAPIALLPLQAADPLRYWGQLVLAATAGLALVLGARRSSVSLLRWVPRAAAVVVVLSAAIAAVLASGALGSGTSASGSLGLSVAAGALLVVGIATAAVLVAVGRGASSLSWSRFGDLIEALCVVFALPAGLVAAGVIDLMRGVMA